MARIDTVDSRGKLKARAEPYWVRLSSGCALGFRKMTSASTGSWIARYRSAETEKREKRSLGEFDNMPPSLRFDAAKKAAEVWFSHLGKGGTNETVTVGLACKRYVQHVRTHRGDQPANDLEMRFKRWVYDDRTLTDVDLTKLTKIRVESWRKAMATTPVKVNRDKRVVPVTRARSASSVNRDISALRAALNYAHDDGAVTTDMAWRVALRPSKNADGRRNAYIDIQQRRLLIDSAPRDLAEFLSGLSSVPLRPGALAALKVSSFETRLSVLTIGKDKAGQDRRIKLPPTTAAMFLGFCQGRSSTEPIFRRQDGQVWNKDAWKKPMKPAVMAAGLPADVTAYTLRHSVITDLVTGGLDLLTVAQLSGTSVAMIERHYGHLRADHAAAALAKLTL